MDPESDFSPHEESSVQDGQESEEALSNTGDHFSPDAADSDFKDSGSDDGSNFSHEEQNFGDENEKLSRRRKRSSQYDSTERPFKRRMGPFNADYLELLNRDIDEAAQRICVDEDFNVPPSQIGLTTWSQWEKRQFFEAVSRLGRHDLAGIASYIGSKSAVEIKHYIDFLEQSRDLRRQVDRRAFLTIAEFPAAVEISPQCCHAQEEAADSIALRQEQRETQREEQKWGPNWDITPEIAARLDRAREDGAQGSLPFAQLFHVARWLKLSERIFMNSSVPSGNWKFVDDAQPSMWATTFADFHSLAVSFTRRLVQTTLFVSMSRIRAKKELVPKTRDVVRRKDVEAAVASLGLAPNAQGFWSKSARRLRLSIYDDDLSATEDSDDEYMTYDAVEHSLGQEPGEEDSKAVQARALSQPIATSAEEDEDEDSLSELEGEEMTPDFKEKQDIRREANELLWRSAVNLQDVVGMRRTLEQSIAMERLQEQQAERWDQYASHEAEMDMWDVLQRKPPVDIPKQQEPEHMERSNLGVESTLGARGDWASKLKYRGEWETGTRG